MSNSWDTRTGIYSSVSLMNLSPFFFRSLRLRIAKPAIASEGSRSSGPWAGALPVRAKRARRVRRVRQRVFLSMMVASSVCRLGEDAVQLAQVEIAAGQDADDGLTRQL